MSSKRKTLDFTPKNTSCYICGKSVADFKSYFNFASHQADHASETGKSGNEAEKDIEHYYGQFVDHYSAEFFEFYDQLMKLPAPVDNLTYTNLRSDQERRTLHQLFPELRDFDYHKLNRWGISHVSKRPRREGGKTRSRRGRGAGGHNIGEFKELLTEITHDLKNKVLNQDIILIINRWYQVNDGCLVKKPAFLGPLNENLSKLKETKRPFMPDIVFSKKKWSDKSVTAPSISYTLYLCPLCYLLVNGYIK